MFTTRWYEKILKQMSLPFVIDEAITTKRFDLIRLFVSN